MINDQPVTECSPTYFKVYNSTNEKLRVDSTGVEITEEILM